MKAKGPVDEQERTESQPIRRRRRSVSRLTLRAKLLAEIRGEKSLADQFRCLLLCEMDERHVTEADLARAYGCSQQNIAQIFNGRTGLRFDTAEKVCRSIGLRIVLSLKEEPRPDLEHE